MSDLVSLATLAKEINIRLAKAADMEGKANDHRIAAGLQLIVARDRVNAEAGSWSTWVKENINRSLRDVQRCIAVAKAPDPDAAREAEKAKAKGGMAETRAVDKATNVSRIVQEARVTARRSVAQAGISKPATDHAERDALRVVAATTGLTATGEVAKLDAMAGFGMKLDYALKLLHGLVTTSYSTLTAARVCPLPQADLTAVVEWLMDLETKVRTLDATTGN